MQKHAPPEGPSSTHTRPWWACTIFLTITRPMPFSLVFPLSRGLHKPSPVFLSACPPGAPRGPQGPPGVVEGLEECSIMVEIGLIGAVLFGAFACGKLYRWLRALSGVMTPPVRMTLRPCENPSWTRPRWVKERHRELEDSGFRHFASYRVLEMTRPIQRPRSWSFQRNEDRSTRYCSSAGSKTPGWCR